MLPSVLLHKLCLRLVKATLLSLPVAIAPAIAQPKLPSPINLVVPFPAGGSADTFVRIMAETMAKQNDINIIVESRPGAAGIIGTRAVVGLKPDGTTLLSTSIVSSLVAPKLVAEPPFDALKDLTPLTPVAEIPALLVVHPSLNIKTFDEFVDYAKNNPHRLNFGNSGTGTLAHLAAELLRRELGVEIEHVPYRGAPPAVSDLIGGHVDAMFSDAAFFIEHIKAGRLVPLAIAAKERLGLLPDVPTMAELGYPDLIAGNIFSVYGPAGMPDEMADHLSNAIRHALAQDHVRQAFEIRAATPVGMPRQEFAVLMEDSAKRWIPLALELNGPPAGN